MSIYKDIVKTFRLAFMVVLLTAASAGSAAAERGAMLYLVEFEAMQSGAPGSPGQAITLLDELIIPSLEQLAANTNIRSGGLLVGARAGVFILEADSHDAVTDTVRALPAWGVWNWKVTPLERFAYRVGVEKKVVETLRGKK